MYKALIIDDEAEAVESVYGAFDWNGLQVSQVVKISEPHGLVDRIVAEAPHVVFIDIEMGVVSGLDVIEACRKLLPEVIFIIISGHDNFEYARTSIRLDVVYYSLKPFTEYEVDIATEKLMNALNVRFGKQTGLQLNDINSYLSNKQQFQDFILDSGVAFPGEYRFLVVCMDQVDLESLSLCLQDGLLKRYKIGSKKYLLVIKEPLSENSMILLENASCFSNMTIGVSGVVKNATEVYSSFKQANMLAYGTFVSERFGVYKVEEGVEEAFNDLMNAVEQGFENEDFEALQLHVAALPKVANSKNFTMEQVVFFHNAFITRLNAVLRQKNKKDFLYVLSFEEILNEYTGIGGMCQTLSDAIKTMLDAYEESATEATKINSAEVVEQVRQYLHENYVQKIRIKDLSNMFYISEAYLSDIFKTLTHKTIIEYLADVRIEAAKEALKATRMNISGIAESVGYGDYCYFNKIFKKYVGVTPYQYRKKYVGAVEHEN